MKVVIADDHALFRDGMVALLTANDIEVVAQAGDGDEAVAMALEHEPDLVLMDLSMPGTDGLEATRRLLSKNPKAQVVILTASEAETSLFEAIKSGARGYLLKDMSTEEFLEHLGGVGNGTPVITPKLAHLIAKNLDPVDDYPTEPLTEREREVLDLMASGIARNKELTERLGVSDNTIKFHLRNIFDKLHLHNRAEVVSYALRNPFDVKTRKS